jgi:flagellar biosynthetic protein FlhB
MMAQVPQSDVVVTNPTHYAVALKYDSGTMAAPKMMAKGVDQVAQKIREIAKEHGIPVIENPPLARALYAAVEVDQEVTPEFYKAVAEVISYIFKLKRRRL